MCSLILSRPPRERRGPDDQIHSCHSETSSSMMPKLCDLVLIFKTCYDKILAKLVNRGVAAALFSSRRLKNFENENTFLCLKVAEIDVGVNFGSKRTNLGIKTYFFQFKPIFRGKYPNSMTCSLLEREIL